jgi:hypothetical protein
VPLRKSGDYISIHSSTFITEIGSVYCAAQTGSLYKIHVIIIIIIIIIRVKCIFSQESYTSENKVMYRHSHVHIYIYIYIYIYELLFYLFFLIKFYNAI